MATDGTGKGLGQDATVQQMLKKLGLSVPQGGTGTGLAQDATLQKLLAVIGGGGGSGGIAFVYQPGGTAGANVYTSWAALYAALSVVQGVVTVQIDDSIVSPAVIPAGTYAIPNVIFTGVANFSTPTGGAHLSLADGCVFTPGDMILEIMSGLYVTSSSTSAVLTAASGQGPFVNVTQGAAIECLAGGSFLHCQAGSFPVMIVHVDCLIGDGTHNVFTLDAGSNCAISLFGASLSANAIGGPGAAAATVSFDSASKVGAPLSGAQTYDHIRSVVHYGADPTGAVDSSTAFTACFAFCNAKGIPALLPAGTFYLTSTPTIPWPLVIEMTGQTKIKQALPTGSFTNSALYAAPGAVVETGTINTTPTVGTQTVIVNLASKPTVGQIVELLHGNSDQMFEITAVSGAASPFTLTLDDAVLMPFVATDTVNVYSDQPHDIYVYGNGATMTGTGGQYIEIARGRDCEINGIHMDCSTADGAITLTGGSMDVGGRRMRWVNCTANMTNAPGGIPAFDIESNVGSWCEGCRAWGVAASGEAFLIVDSVYTGWRNCRAFDSAGNGFVLGTDAALGSFDCSVTDCKANNCNIGLQLATTTRPVVSSSAFNYCSTAGLQVEAATTAATLTGLDLCNNSRVNAAGLAIAGGQVVGKNIRADGCYIGINASASFDIDGFTALNHVNEAVTISAGTLCKLTHFETSTAGAFGGIDSAATRLELAHGKTTTAGVYGILASAGLVTLDNVTVNGASTTALEATGATMRVGSGCDFSGSSGFITLGAGGHVNRKQTLVANGTTGVAVAWPNIKATDVVQFTMQIPSGAFGDPTYTITPGTGFTFTSTAATDLGTYEYFIP